MSGAAQGFAHDAMFIADQRRLADARTFPAGRHRSVPRGRQQVGSKTCIQGVGRQYMQWLPAGRADDMTG